MLQNSLDINSSIEVVTCDIFLDPLFGPGIVIHLGKLIIRDSHHDFMTSIPVPAKALMVESSESKSFTFLIPLSFNICIATKKKKNFPSQTKKHKNEEEKRVCKNG